MKYRSKTNPDFIIKACQFTGIKGDLGENSAYPKWMFKALRNGEIKYTEEGLKSEYTRRTIEVGGYVINDTGFPVLTKEDFRSKFEPLHYPDEILELKAEIKKLEREVLELRTVVYEM